MKLNFATLLVIAGLSAAPFAAYAADAPADTKPTMKEKAGDTKETVKEKASETKSKVKRVSKDTSITTKVKAKFAKDSDVSALKIHVKTKSGVVTLTGKAKSDAEKSKAEDLAKEVEGVKSVTNNIKVAASK